MSKDLSKPVTPESSKKELWEELGAARNEISQQQELIKQISLQRNKAIREKHGVSTQLEVLRYQFSVIRAAIAIDLTLEP